MVNLARSVIGLALIRSAQVPEPCQKRGKVGSVKQRLLAELGASEVTSFDRCVQRSAADTEQLKCLVDRIRYFRKAESRRVDRINSGALVVAHTRHCVVRRNVFKRFARVSHSTHCVTRLGENEQPKSALYYAMASARWALRLFCLASSSVSRSDRARHQPPCPMTRTISAMAFAASASSLRVDSDELRRRGVSRLASCVQERMASAAISGVTMPSQPGPRAAFHSPAVRGAGVVAAVAKSVVGADTAVRARSAVRSQIRLCLLGEPKSGRRQAVKAGAAKRGRDSDSL